MTLIIFELSFVSAQELLIAC